MDSGHARMVLSYFGADFGSTPGGPYAFPAAVQTKRSLEIPVGWYGQPLLFAAMAQRYAYEFGLTAEQQAAVVISNRDHASRTPGAMKRDRSEEHTSELQSLMRTSYAVFCLKQKKTPANI